MMPSFQTFHQHCVVCRFFLVGGVTDHPGQCDGGRCGVPQNHPPHSFRYTNERVHAEFHDLPRNLASGSFDEKVQRSCQHEVVVNRQNLKEREREGEREKRRERREKREEKRNTYQQTVRTQAQSSSMKVHTQRTHTWNAQHCQQVVCQHILNFVQRFRCVRSSDNAIPTITKLFDARQRSQQPT